MLERLNAHRAWANGQYAEWMASLPSVDDYCLKMFSHVLRAEEAWLARLRGEVAENRIWSLVPVEAMTAMRAAHDSGLEEALKGDLARVFRYNRFDGTPMESTAADILTHVCTHGMYHRAQIAARAAQAPPPGPAKVPGTDFIAFSRLFP
jgi:uncharacterized damage-inducible protein DinB